MCKLFRHIIRKIDEFWFHKESTLTLGVFRIAFGGLLFLSLLITYPNWERFYGAHGLYPLSVFIQAQGGFFPAATASILTWSEANWLLWSIFWLSIIASIAFLVGVCTYPANIVLWVIWASITHRNPFILDGHDQVVFVLLFLSLFAPLGSSLSVDKMLNPKHQRLSGVRTARASRESVWGWRLMQVSIATIYLCSVPLKLVHDVAWMDGSAIYYLSVDKTWFRFPEVDFLHNQVLSIYATYSSLVIQALFPFLIWFKSTRSYILALTIMFHASIGILMNNYVLPFSITMLIALLLFIQPATFQRYINQFNRIYIRVHDRFAGVSMK